MKCFVTGASGYIGSCLVKRLSQEGHEIIGLIHNNPPKNTYKNVEYKKGDITDIKSIEPIVKEIDVVFHCAAHVKDYGVKTKFLDINVNGTKNLIQVCKENEVKRFIFISHMRYEKSKKMSFYSETKHIAEEILKEEHQNNNFPFVIIKPGNVYGPDATIWVVRNINSIKKGRISLIDSGKGIFHHTYIDNLLDALILSMDKPEAVGKSFNITDGDNSVTFKEYFNRLSKMLGKKPIERNMSKKAAMFVGKLMLFLNKIFRIEPWVTPFSVEILTNQKYIDIKEARDLLGYTPKVDFNQGMSNVENWLKNERYINE